MHMYFTHINILNAQLNELLQNEHTDVTTTQVKKWARLESSDASQLL